jgi:hypothetical protein
MAVAGLLYTRKFKCSESITGTIKMENMMGGEYSMHGTSDRYAKCIVEKSEPKIPLEDLVVYGRIILKWR